MPDIITERIPGILTEWAEEHPIIRVYLDDHPNGWALEAWTQGRRILRDEDGNGSVYYTEVPPSVTRAIYGWLNSIAPIWTSQWFTVHDDSIEWLDHDTGLGVNAYQDSIGTLQVSMFDPRNPGEDCEGMAFMGVRGMSHIIADGDMAENMKRVSSAAHKYFYPN